ncbi:hypothetical protein ACFL5Y_00620 [Candidatus Omnitrophota bacterium]
MMSKEELLTILENARLAEEKSIPIYTKHLKSAVFWTGVKQEDVEKIRETLRILAEESEKHKKIVEDLIEQVKTKEKNAF